MNRQRPAAGQHGQTIVIVALAMVALIGAVAVVIDGGNAFAQQRRAQNGIDAAAEAGATQLARRMVGMPGNDDAWTTNVLNAVGETATNNGISSTDVPQWTDRTGTVLGPVAIGNPIPAATQGVAVRGSLEFDTYIANILGSPHWTASASATAITGFAEESGFGGVIPLTIPILLTECQSGGGSDKLVFPSNGIEWPFGPNNLVAIPLCSNGPGNVGWIDWDPPGGGVNEVATSIVTPDNDPISTPHWKYITETGANVALDPAMDTWEGKDILIPIFHAEEDNPATPADERLIGTCDAIPDAPQTNLNDCHPPDMGANGQGWYFLETFGTFHLLHAYIQNNHQAECNDTSVLVSPASPIGSTNPVNTCLIGYFKDRVVASNMTVGSATSSSSFTPLAIQLIK
jgi:Flp pilus assembly protein TadG